MDIEKLAEQRLIDANKILYHQAWESGSMEPANEGVALMSEVQAMPTIDPEALPIVRQLREELERVTAERDAAVSDLRGRAIESYSECMYCLYRTAKSFCWNCNNGSNWTWRGLHKEE